MFTLYHDKKERVLKVEPARAIFGKDYFRDSITTYNSNYYFCNHEQPLLEKAEKIKALWLEETESDLDKINKIKIK